MDVFTDGSMPETNTSTPIQVQENLLKGEAEISQPEPEQITSKSQIGKIIY